MFVNISAGQIEEIWRLYSEVEVDGLVVLSLGRLADIRTCTLKTAQRLYIYLVVKKGLVIS